MEFGTFMEFDRRAGSTEAEAFEEAFAHADMAEELGLDAIWVAEAHFVPDRSVASAQMVLASAIAARTKRIRIATAIHVLPLGHPLRIAEEAATLDHVSQGRLEFGIGRSAMPADFEPYNIPLPESRERFFEYLDIIVKAWTNERFSYEGKYFSCKDVCLVPKPYQTPHPPLRVATTTSESFRAMGERGLPIGIALRTVAMPRVAEQVRSYQQARKEAGHQGPADVALRVPVYVAEAREKALSEPQESLMRQYKRLGNQILRVADRPGVDEERTREGRELASLTWEQALRDRVAVGTPEMVVERLQEMRETLHLSGVIAEFHPGEGKLVPRENIAQSLRLFCEKVMPAFK